MGDGLEITINITRVMIREAILNAIKELREEQGIEMKNIISELLSIASSAVAKLDSELNDVTISTLDDDPDEDEWGDESEDEDTREYNLWAKFVNSDVHKKISSLHDEHSRLTRLERHADAVKVYENILDLLPEDATRWNSIVGNDKYSDHNQNAPIDSLMRAYVALLNNEGLDRVKSTAQKANEITKILDEEIFDMDYRRFKEDLGTMKIIYGFIGKHPNFPQKNLFRELSIDGRKAGYMLNWAEKLGRIKRIRHKDTWLLSISNA